MAELVAAGVPAAVASDPRRMGAPPAVRARGYIEVVDHPVAGPLPTPVLPFRVRGRRPLGPHARASLR